MEMAEATGSTTGYSGDIMGEMPLIFTGDGQGHARDLEDGEDQSRTVWLYGNWGDWGRESRCHTDDYASMNHNGGTHLVYGDGRSVWGNHWLLGKHYI